MNNDPQSPSTNKMTFGNFDSEPGVGSKRKHSESNQKFAD